MVSPSDKQMLRDANGDLIPQYWDVVEQDFKPLTGQGGANDVRLTGSKVELIAMVSYLTIPTGTNVNVISGFSADRYNSIFVQIRPRGAKKYRISYRPVIGTQPSSSLLEMTILDIEGSAANRVSEYFLVMGLYGSIYLENNTSTDHSFGDIALYGVKS